MRKQYRAGMAFLCLLAILGLPAWALEPAAQPTERGADVSAWQGEIDFAQVKEAGMETVYIRAGVGAGYKDPYFERNYENAKASGLKVGFYHYMTARTGEEARRQAQFFARLMAGKEPDCRPAMDFESFGALTRAQVNEIARVYLETLEEACGCPVAVYSDAWNAANVFDASLARYPLWVAEYGPGEPSTGGAWPAWAGFQYSDSGRVAGIAGDVDLDYFTPALALEQAGRRPNPGGGRTYTVVRGDTLSKIARRFGTTVDWLAWANHIQNVNYIVPGQVLDLPEAGAGTRWYTVVRGDTLSQIARRFGCTVDEIAEINRIPNVNLIYPGQRLEICREPQVYTVRRGDTLWAIARRYGVSLQWLIRENGIADPNLIYPGQQIRV